MLCEKTADVLGGFFFVSIQTVTKQRVTARYISADA